MSKIAKRVILVPASAKVYLQERTIYAEGPLGESEKLSLPPELKVVQEKNELFTKSDNLALAGTYNSLISNLIKGVVEGYEETLELEGAGYKVVLENNRLGFDLGRSHHPHRAHHDYVDILVDLKVTVEGNSKIIIKGKNKQKVRQFAVNSIQNLRRPGIYKTKGIYCGGEKTTIKLKTPKSIK